MPRKRPPSRKIKAAPRVRANAVAPQSAEDRATWRGWRDGWTYRLLYVRCTRCRSCLAGNYSHGPYWYAERKLTVRRGRRWVVALKTLYVGRILRPVDSIAAARASQ